MNSHPGASQFPPIFVDESCRMSSDIPGFADRVDGVNLKLMKCGGITEALRIVATARAFGLKTMIGCMGESSISIATGASLGALFDYIDLEQYPHVKRWREAIGKRKAVDKGCRLLEDVMKLGDPD